MSLLQWAAGLTRGTVSILEAAGCPSRTFLGHHSQTPPDNAGWCGQEAIGQTAGKNQALLWRHFFKPPNHTNTNGQRARQHTPHTKTEWP